MNITGTSTEHYNSTYMHNYTQGTNGTYQYMEHYNYSEDGNITTSYGNLSSSFNSSYTLSEGGPFFGDDYATLSGDEYGTSWDNGTY